MDQAPLVECQIDDGLKLLERLAHEGFEVTAACWAMTTEDGRWYFYLASPVVDKGGSLKAYRVVQAVMRQMPQPFSIDLMEIKAIEVGDPLAEGVAAFNRRFPLKTPTRYTGTRLGRVSIEGAYIYPPIPDQLQ